MSTTLYIALDRDIPGLQTDNDRVFLAEILGKDESAVARAAHVRPLADFQSYSRDELASIMDDPPKTPVKWFEPADALPAVRALLSHYGPARFMVERARFVGGKWESADRTDDLLAELRDCENVLSAAAQSGAKFRFHVGF